MLRQAVEGDVDQVRPRFDALETEKRPLGLAVIRALTSDATKANLVTLVRVLLAEPMVPRGERPAVMTFAEEVLRRVAEDASCPHCYGAWTLDSIRSFVKSLFGHIDVLTPSEMFALAMQAGALRGKSSQAFVKALTTGRFPVREAHRCLALDEHLHIWEPANYFDDPEEFREDLRRLGFDVFPPQKQGLFLFFHATKNAQTPDPDITLHFRGRGG